MGDKKTFDLLEKSFSDEGEKFFYPPSDFLTGVKTSISLFFDHIL